MLTQAPLSLLTACPIADHAFAALDLETTGLKPGIDRIVEFGAVRFSRRELGDSFSALVDPGIPVTPGAAAVSGITDFMLRGKPSPTEVLPDFISFLERRVLIAHHAVFDSDFSGTPRSPPDMRFRNP